MCFYLFDMKLLQVTDEIHKAVKTMAVKKDIKLNEATKLVIEAGLKETKKAK